MFMPLPDDETLLKLLGAVPFMPRMDSSYNPDKNWLTIEIQCCDPAAVRELVRIAPSLLAEVIRLREDLAKQNTSASRTVTLIPPPGANIEAVCNPEITENWVYQAKIGNTIRSVDSGIHHSQPISIIPPPWVLAAFGVQAIAHK